MISPYTALPSQLNTGNASASPLVTANKVYDAANNNLEATEHSDVLAFAMIATQSHNTANPLPNSAVASSTNITETTLVQKYHPTNTALSTPISQQLSNDRPVASSLMANVLPSPTATQTNSTNQSGQSTTSLQQVSQQSFAPPQLQHNHSATPNAAIVQNAFQGLAAAQPMVAAIASEVLATEGVDSTQHIISSTAKTHASVAQWGPVSVSQSAPLLMQAQEMLSPLREQLRFQIDQQIKQAELRLDPPELGKVELNIRLDGDRLHIQMHAANPAVRDALLMGLDRLRNELAMDHGGQIDVDINQQGEQKEHNQPPHNPTIAAASLSNTDSSIDNFLQQDDVDLLA